LALDELNSILRRVGDDDAEATREIEAMRDDLLRRVPLLRDRDQLRAARRLTDDADELIDGMQSRWLFPFSTAVLQSDIDAFVDDDMRLAFYDATIELYQQMLSEDRSLSRLSSTEKNHRFFKYQMKILDKTGEYWQGFRQLPLYKMLLKCVSCSIIVEKKKTSINVLGACVF
jgi:hypothetical protein